MPIAFRKASALFAVAVSVACVSAVYAANPQNDKTAKTQLTDSYSLFGSYLAGHLARAARDSDNAALYYQRALARDPGNADILNDTFQLEVAAGNYDTALRLAQRLARRPKATVIAQLFAGLDAFRKREYGRADEYFRAAERTAAGDPTIKLARAWTLLAIGRADKAIAALSTPSKAEWAVQFETVQRAFIADAGRKRAEAAQAYKTVYERNPTSSRIAEAYARHLAFWGDRDQALRVISSNGADIPPMGKALKAEIESGKRPRLLVTTPEEGLSEVFVGVGQVLATNNGVDAALVYLRKALFLNPASDVGVIELADTYAGLEQYQRANDLLQRIPEKSPFRLSAQLKTALNLNSLKKEDEAVALLQTLLTKQPNEAQILQTLASVESARKRYEAAIPFYDRAISLVAKPEKKHWGLFYARGIAFERTKQWAKAEPDFKKALELNPEEPSVLNYLGYSWIDQNINIKQAFEYVQRAVKLRPNDGYIVDSLGWGYYVQGDYENAVKHLDRAVDLRPEDPTLNDHLGDVYWRLGRELEARFQWTQALTLNPEPDDAAKIKKKLENGLKDEPKAPPATAAATQAAPLPASEPEGNVVR
jgi:tetratricopeptide (TPR) repeat protein